jgi:hypothetical protein
MRLSGKERPKDAKRNGGTIIRPSGASGTGAMTIPQRDVNVNFACAKRKSIKSATAHGIEKRPTKPKLIPAVVH